MTAAVLTANIGILLDLYGVEKGLEHYRSTPTLNFQHFKYYLLKEVFLPLPNTLSLSVLHEFESKIDETCWLICKKDYVEKCQMLPEDCMYKLFRVFCFLSELITDPEKPNRFQVIMDTSEVGLVASQIVTSLGTDWDQSGFEELVGNASGFQFGTFLTVLEKRYLADVDRAGLVEALNAVTNMFIDDIIKKGVLLKRGYLLPTLREYWFVLKPCQLLYYKNQEEKEQCGSIMLDPRCWVDSNLQRIMLHTTERTFELATKDHRSRLQWLSAFKLAISYSAGTEGYQRTLLHRRQKQRKAELQEKHRRSSIIHDMDAQLQAEKLARAAVEIQAKELKVASEKHVEELECLLEEETKAKRDEEIVRNLQARVLREEWEKREELERLQEEQKLLLEQEREKRKEFEMKQKEKENQLLEAQQRLIELEAEKQRLDDELSRAQKKISVSEKAVASLTDVQSADGLNVKPQVKVRRTMSFIPSTKERPYYY
ncbi:differentially expressed in FDCP 6 homolog isoform X2 [Adelges cooleyi]|uniref:differentially expressed in FDCP 6 homolog isoform X2 n=1 Tax=Adelges cooleyi TaxID=133065 RepID=UPI00217F624D|nr:differentially expressed in FDCP 6 homolog isoform X2 [Adelges cooleyi]